MRYVVPNEEPDGVPNGSLAGFSAAYVVSSREIIGMAMAIQSRGSREAHHGVVQAMRMSL